MNPSGIVRKTTDPGTGQNLGTAHAPLANVTSSGKGREWKTTTARGFWKTFAELDLSSTDQIATFYRRYGDPLGLLAEEGASDTGFWRNYQALLLTAAQAWEPVDAEGISHRTNDAARIKEARWFLRNVPRIHVEMEQDRTTGNTVPVAKTLADYMLLSASQMLAANMPMRRCGWCSHWFGLTDARSLYCSVACRNAAHRSRKEI